LAKSQVPASGRKPSTCIKADAAVKETVSRTGDIKYWTKILGFGYGADGADGAEPLEKMESLQSSHCPMFS
jgi:hypothetical protein